MGSLILPSVPKVHIKKNKEQNFYVSFPRMGQKYFEEDNIKDKEPLISEYLSRNGKNLI